MFAAAYIFLADSIFGQVSPPPGVAAFNAKAPGGIGLILFMSNLIKIITLIAGFIGLFNIISAGYTYLSSDGNPKAAEEAGDKMKLSLIGLIVIVGSFTIAAIVGLLLFGDAGFILNPKIPSVSP